MSEINVADVPGAARFEARVGTAVAGYSEYILTDDLIVFSHTEVDPNFEGQGVGSALVRSSLDEARARRLAVLPICPFYAGWIRDHPDYQDLVYRPVPSRVTD